MEWKEVYESSALTQFVELYVVELLGEVLLKQTMEISVCKLTGCVNCLVLWGNGLRNR